MLKLHFNLTILFTNSLLQIFTFRAKFQTNFLNYSINNQINIQKNKEITYLFFIIKVILTIQSKETFIYKIQMSSVLYSGTDNSESVLQQKHPNIIQKQHQRQSKFSNKLTIDPQTVLINFQPDKPTINKITVKNQYSFKINFKIYQPKKSSLNIKCKKNSLNPKETIQIFVFFNPAQAKQIITIGYQDEFVIALEKQKTKLYVPIICKPRIKRFSLKRSSLSLRGNSQFIENFALSNNQKNKSQRNLLELKKPHNHNKIFSNSFQSMINNFLERFSVIHQYVKEKNVKKQIFIGQKALTVEKQKKIIKQNKQIAIFIESEIKKKVQSRLVVQFSGQGPVVRNFEGIILRWNKQKNIPSIIYKKALAKVQQQVRKYLINRRFQKIHHILSLYDQFKKSNLLNNLEQQKRYQIYMQKLQKKLHKKSQINLQLNFDKNSLCSTNIDVQYENKEVMQNYVFEINPRIGFDNWVAIQESIMYTHEIMKYTKKVPYNEWNCHPKLQQNGFKNKNTYNIKTQKQENSNNISSNSFSSPKNIISNQMLCNLIEQHSNHPQISQVFQILNLDDNKKPQEKQQKVSKNIKNNRISKRIISQKQHSNNYIAKQQNNDLIKTIFYQCSSINRIQFGNKKNIDQMGDMVDRNSQQVDFHQVEYDFLPQKQYIFKSMEYYTDKKYELQQNAKSLSSCIKSILNKPSYYSSILNSFSFQKNHLQPFKQIPNTYLLQELYPYTNSIIRKIPKEDKYQFDHLRGIKQHLLCYIEKTQETDQLRQYKLACDIDIEIPNKKIKNFYDNSNREYECGLENIKVEKLKMLGKRQYLQVFLKQNSNNGYRNAIIFE